MSLVQNDPGFSFVFKLCGKIAAVTLRSDTLSTHDGADLDVTAGSEMGSEAGTTELLTKVLFFFLRHINFAMLLQFFPLLPLHFVGHFWGNK